MWVACRFSRFEDFRLLPESFPILVQISVAPFVGYLPVYATREEAEREHPGIQVVEIREVANAQGNR